MKAMHPDTHPVSWRECLVYAGCRLLPAWLARLGIRLVLSLTCMARSLVFQRAVELLTSRKPLIGLDISGRIVKLSWDTNQRESFVVSKQCTDDLRAVR
jgi:hypothetical protein